MGFNASENNSDAVQGTQTQTSDESLMDLVPCGSSEETPARKVTADDCEAALEVQDSFVSCVEGLELQHVYEEENLRCGSNLLDHYELPDAHLTHDEAACIVSQVTQQAKQRQSETELQGKGHVLTDIDTLTLSLCGTDSEDAEDQRRSSQLTIASESNAASHVVESAQQCAICFDEVLPQNVDSHVTFAELPCCGKADDTSTVQICTACILLLTQPTSEGSRRIGRCPRCREWLVAHSTDPQAPLESLQINTVDHAGTCQICNQVKDHLVDENTCDACFLGRRLPLLYECESCQGAQRIPHPMYRYQAAPGEFGTKTWACQGPCQNFTHWRIRFDQLKFVPAGDAPWSAAPEDWQRNAQEQVRMVRSSLVPTATQIGNAAEADSCVIL